MHFGRIFKFITIFNKTNKNGSSQLSVGEKKEIR